MNAPEDPNGLREALARAEAERDEAERGKAAALGLQNGGAIIIRQLEAERDALKGQRDELQGLIVTAEICAECAITRALAAEAHAEIVQATLDAEMEIQAEVRASLLAAEAEITRLKEGMEAMGAALEPFATFAEDMVDDEGWCSLEYRASISTWFGPSQFRTARQALATISPKEPTHG